MRSSLWGGAGGGGAPSCLLAAELYSSLVSPASVTYGLGPLAPPEASLQGVAPGVRVVDYAGPLAHKHMLSWLHLYPWEQRLTCLISAQLFTPFPGLTLNAALQRRRELQREDLLGTLPSRPVTASEMWLK